MLLSEAKEILRNKGYRLIKEFRAMDSDNNVIEDPDLKDMDFDYNEDDYKPVNKIITVDHIDEDNYKDFIGKTVNVEGDVNLNELGLAKLPIKFNKVGGNFWCAWNKLTSLEGCPKSVGKSFYCSGNRFTSLEGCPKTVGGKFDCGHNNLTSLEGCPKTVGGKFDCCDNNLTSLEGCPITVGESFDCSFNELISLEGCPKSVGGDFYCGHNKLTSLKGCPETVCGDFYCYDNKVQFTEEEVEELCDVNGIKYII